MKLKGRTGIYDEIFYTSDPKNKNPWDGLETLYRNLKQNYEDRKNYARAGDFHFGEKEMRLSNPETPWWDKRLLRIYWALSCYGERAWPPMLWLASVILVASFAYYFALNSAWDWSAYVNTLLYSAQVSSLSRPTELELHGMVGLINLFQTILSPILLGLLALAIRQRLKR